MQADWEIEIGPGAPIMDAQWPSFLDLRQHPGRIHELPETTQNPGLAYALVQLNRPKSPVWTSKCDLWLIVDTTTLDPDELDAQPESTVCAVACYIDLLPKSDQQWQPLAKAVAEAKAICQLLQAIPQPNCRADLILRQAFLTSDVENTGITAYLTACGPTTEAASQTLQLALKTFADTLESHSTLK